MLPETRLYDRLSWKCVLSITAVRHSARNNSKILRRAVNSWSLFGSEIRRILVRSALIRSWITVPVARVISRSGSR
jgi:hypothetical protein